MLGNKTHELVDDKGDQSSKIIDLPIVETQLYLDPTKFWFISQTTGAPSGDHMLQIANGEVSCDGRIQTDTVEFNLYYGHDGTKSVGVLHCASGRYKGNLIQIKNNGDISFRMPTVVEVFKAVAKLNIDDVGKDALFEYSGDSNDIFHFRLRDDKKLVLGFTDSGEPRSTYSYGSINTLLKRQEVITT